jgi:hypothetical protein
MKGAVTFGQLLALLAIAAILIPASFLVVPKLIPKEMVPITTGEAQVQVQCPQDLTTDIAARAKNPLAISPTYLAAPVTLFKSDQKVLTTTLTSTGDYATVTTNGECGASDYSLVVVNSPSYVAKKVSVPRLTGAIKYVDFDVAPFSEVEFRVFDSSWSPLTTGFVQDVATDTAISLSAGSSADVRIQYRAKSPNAQFGSDELKSYICADFNLAKYSKDQGVTISGAGVVGLADTLPKYCAENGYEKAWVINPVKSTEATKEIMVSIKADLGDPTSADSIKLIWVDEHYFIGNDGKLKSGTSDDASNNVGGVNRFITISVS